MVDYDRARAVEKCQSKRWYETKEAAEAEMDRLARFPSNKPHFQYQCAICDLYHLTTKPTNPGKDAFFRGLEENYRARIRGRR